MIIKSALDSFSLLRGGVRHVEGILKPEGLVGSEPMVAFTSDKNWRWEQPLTSGKSNIWPNYSIQRTIRLAVLAQGR